MAGKKKRFQNAIPACVLLRKMCLASASCKSEQDVM
jgi:hypothetical protein